MILNGPYFSSPSFRRMALEYSPPSQPSPEDAADTQPLRHVYAGAQKPILTDDPLAEEVC